jgi:hypothetical protein
LALSSSSIAQLEYDAARERLTGTIGTAPYFDMMAYSGGSRGHKAGVSPKKAREYLHKQAGSLMTHLATTKMQIDGGGHYIRRGGTLPPGHYTCHYVGKHHVFGECIQLKRTADALAIHSPFSPHPIPHGRDDFFIHGSGPKGSDGCIVPVDTGERHRLNVAVKNFQGQVMLLVKHVSYMLPAELEGQLG